MKKRKIVYGILLLLLLTACSQIKNAKENGLYVEKSGKITEAIVETFDEDYYSKEELNVNILSAIKTYNDEKKEDRISLKNLRLKDKKIRALLQYKSYKDYQNFNKVFLFVGGIKQAGKAGIDLNIPVFSNEEEKTERLLSDLQSEKSYKVLVVDKAMHVEVEGKILFAGKNVKIEDKKNAKAVYDKEMAEGNYSYIIYK
ncbi:MAG TPA: hypothetical protein VIR32_09880 [Lachnospiraceae bacterium]